MLPISRGEAQQGIAEDRTQPRFALCMYIDQRCSQSVLFLDISVELMSLNSHSHGCTAHNQHPLTIDDHCH
jgi:hypothetical protein